MGNLGDDFTPAQMRQLEPLIRSKRQDVPTAIFSMIFSVLRNILNLPRNADPLVIVLTILARILGLNGDGNDILSLVNDVSERVNRVG